MQREVNRVQLSEIFTSIEGEGILFGTKTIFIRMAGCHLKCRWCDTSYALSSDSGNNYSIDDVKKLIAKHLQPNTYKANFSGGEPLLQYNAVIELAKFVKEKGLRTYIESSCFDSGRFAKVLPYIDICKVEFKMSDSKVVDLNHYENLLRNEMECLTTSIRNHKITYIKIIVTNATNVCEFKDLINNVFKYVKISELAGFIIQPSYGVDEPTVKRLLGFYDIVYPLYEEVRIIPQLHKVIGAR